MSKTEPSGKIDLESPTANMFGIQPCPKCKQPYRYLPKQPDGKLIIRCDDCGLEEAADEQD